MMLKPDDDEIEISIFGTGYGECIAVHVGFGNWILIDSCRGEFDSKLPLHLQYLQDIGCNPADVIKLIICTHWHDDHIRGLSEVFKIAVNSPILISDALQKDEFFKLLATLQGVDINSVFTTGVDELGKIIDENQVRPAKEIKWAICNRTETIQVSEKYRVLVHILSPSDEEVLDSRSFFAKLQPSIAKPIKVIADPKRNPYSVVVSFEIHNDSILLGGDKENVASANSGWEKICANFALGKPLKSSIYKVAHHGSKSGHNERIWDQMLTSEPWALLSSFTRSRLPNKNDVHRILEKTDKAFCVGATSPQHSPLDPETKKLLRDFGEMDKKIYRVGKRSGQIILRKKIFQTVDWKVQMIGNAYKLKKEEQPA
jgi:hypothetical protein